MRVESPVKEIPKVLLLQHNPIGNTNGQTKTLSEIKNPNEASLMLESQLATLKKIASDLRAVHSIDWLLMWDSDNYMPKANVEERAWQAAFLAKQSQKILTSDEMIQLLEEFSNEEKYKKLNKIEQALVRELKRLQNKHKNIPADVTEGLAKAMVKGHFIWASENGKVDFNLHKSMLENIVSFKRQIANSIKTEGNSSYDALLDDYETGMTRKDLDKVFTKIKNELIPLLRAISKAPKQYDLNINSNDYDHKVLLELSRELLETMGFDLTRGFFEESTSLFTLGIASNDIRLTTEIDKSNLSATICTILHEGGHGVHYQGFNPELGKTPLFDAASIGIDESQARLYEQIIGLGEPFVRYLFQRLQEKFPEKLNKVSFEEFYKVMNHIELQKPAFASDEVTHNLYAILLYEIEGDLIDGSITVDDILPIWSNKMSEYLGVTPNPEVQNPMHNSYWISGDFGYIPTYVLGNLYAAQIYNTIKKEIPDVESQIVVGNLKPVREWLREKIHFYAKTETPKEMILRVTGEPLNPDYYINYIKEKYTKLYNLQALTSQ